MRQGISSNLCHTSPHGNNSPGPLGFYFHAVQFANQQHADAFLIAPSDFYDKYKTPFERVRDDLKENYGVENPSQAIFNLFIQGSKHYDQFTSNIGELMQLEQDFMSRIVGGRVNNILDLNRVYVENIGNIFIESMNINADYSL